MAPRNSSAASDQNTSQSPGTAGASGAASGGAEPTALPVDHNLVTYRPGPQDPPQVKWRGLLFRAFVPKPVKNPDHVEGEDRECTCILCAARANRFFHVGPFDPQRDGRPTHDTEIKPIDGRSYRAHVVAWLKKVDSAEDLIQRWAGDQAMRDSCEDIGTDDYLWLGSLIEPRLTELLKRDELDAAHETALWTRYGVALIPWRTESQRAVTG